MTTSQKSGDDSTNIQAGRDIILANTVALYSIEEVAKQLLNSVFGELPSETKEKIESNQKSYFQALSDNLERIVKQNEELKEVVESPDFQYISKKASVSASRSSSVELHKNLSLLIVKRINCNNEDLKRIVYDEAILTADKLTLDQLKIITLSYLLGRTSYQKIVSWETFKDYLNTHIKPFLDFKNTDAEFEHIEYTGCGSLGLGMISWDLVNIFRENQSFLFFNLIEKNEIEGLELADEIKRNVFALDAKENKYFIGSRNKTVLEKYLKENNVLQETIDKLIAIYQNHIKNNEEIKKKIIEETDIGKKLMDLWEKSGLNRLSLTSVGIAIAISYFEQIVDEKINIDLWIN